MSNKSPAPARKPLSVHPKLKPLRDALIGVVCRSDLLASIAGDVEQLRAVNGPPKPEHWPGTYGLERAREAHEAWVRDCEARDEPELAEPYIEPCWTRRIRDWTDAYTGWHKAIETALELVDTNDVASIMDTGRENPLDRWTVQTIMRVRELRAVLDPMRVGEDGRGFIRNGGKLPEAYAESVAAVARCVDDLAAVPASGAGSVRRSGGTGNGRDYKAVRRALHLMRQRGESFTSYRELGRQFKCTGATVKKAIEGDKAIKGDPVLEGWRARSEEAKPCGSRPAAPLNDVTLDRTAGTSEPDPVDAAGSADEETLLLIDGLIDKAEDNGMPKFATMIRDMTPDKQKALAAKVREHGYDDVLADLKKPAHRRRAGPVMHKHL